MKKLVVSEAVKTKLQKRHQVTLREVEHCFMNMEGRLLYDNRALTKTNPPTLWFIALTNQNRKHKIVYIQKGSQVILKTAYEPNAVELDIYERFGMAA
ncbi:MAG: ADP-ribosyl-(dinitrogen reductase) hydrolase [Limnohabitans sp.]